MILKIILYLLIFVFFIFIGIFFSKLSLEINNLKYNSINQLGIRYDINLKLYIYNYIKFFTIRITNVNIYINGIKIKKSKFENTNLYNKIVSKFKNADNFKLIKEELKKKALKKIIKEIKFEIKKINSYVEIGTNNIELTTIIVTLLNILFPILINLGISKYDKNKYNYEIKSNYIKSIFNIHLACIINVEIAHIISIILKLKKESVCKNDRTSYRRFNENCNEQYKRYDRC